jgi:hypothetical protein
MVSENGDSYDSEMVRPSMDVNEFVGGRRPIVTVTVTGMRDCER